LKWGHKGSGGRKSPSGVRGEPSGGLGKAPGSQSAAVKLIGLLRGVGICQENQFDKNAKQKKTYMFANQETE